MRHGAELVRATKPFTVEDRPRTWRLLGSTVAVQVGLGLATAFAPWWPVKLLGSTLMGLTIVRLFIFYHDYLHGAIFKDSRLGRWAMYAVGFYTLSPPSVWKETHDYHHQNNAKLLGSAIGSYPLVSLGIWRAMSPQQRLGYRVLRHPLFMGLAWVTMFMLGMCLVPFRRNPRGHWSSMPVLLGYWGVLVASYLALGAVHTVTLVVLPGVISSMLGAYLFYAQHNFPDAVPLGRREWNYHHAALKCSSMFDMSPLLHWFTGNIGFHHVHHLNHKIPFYRLPEAMDAMPELQSPGRTSWAPADVLACLRIGVWDPKAQRLLSYREASEQLAAQAA